ncbi:MAG TPA: PRC-barrel domain-containing protein [Solirubrobacteraceae bacterium]|nr:PRC-barrel domain-containing protein [Solirubrobacteraceae bacterium]
MASASEQSTESAEQEEATANGEGASSPDETSAQEEDGSKSGDTSADSDTQEEGEDSEDQDEGGAASGRSIASAIEDVSTLSGETINDQDGRKIGQVKEIYGVGDDEAPMWVTIESATGLGRKRQVFVPLARIKNQADEFRVPYSFDHVHDSPEVEPQDEISEEDDRALRVYYAIGLADQELVESARSYASQVPEEEGPATKIDADSAEGPARELDDTPPAKRVAEAYEKQKEEQGDEHRKGSGATADAVFEDDGSGDGDEEPEGEEKEPKGEADED